MVGLELRLVHSVMGTRRHELVPSFGRRDAFIETVLLALVEDVREGTRPTRSTVNPPRDPRSARRAALGVR
jgi:hypothetical protein